MTPGELTYSIRRLVYGASKEAQIPAEGALISEITWRNGTVSAYLTTIAGSNIGTRHPEELTFIRPVTPNVAHGEGRVGD